MRDVGLLLVGGACAVVVVLGLIWWVLVERWR